ncbi:MAG: dUTP diphosphatase [Spirochaetes bacterium]|nr:dUTP diphosphatase [Spirochaetota bacterium]MBU1082208.1 dUTP diphosphatase [Spirochaetota bacterium]
MNEPVVAIELSAGASAPEYQTEGSAGADIRARVGSPVVIPPGARALIPTGIRMQLPRGYEAQIRSRSGLAAKHGISCLNSPGTIDSDYRGEVSVILQNHGSEPYVVADGDRIAQMVVAPVSTARFVAADSLPGSARGSGGFGSTGR